MLDKQLGEIGVPRRSFGLPCAMIRHYSYVQGHSEGTQTARRPVQALDGLCESATKDDRGPTRG